MARGHGSMIAVIGAVAVILICLDIGSAEAQQTGRENGRPLHVPDRQTLYIGPSIPNAGATAMVSIPFTTGKREVLERREPRLNVPAPEIAAKIVARTGGSPAIPSVALGSARAFPGTAPLLQSNPAARFLRPPPAAMAKQLAPAK